MSHTRLRMPFPVDSEEESTTDRLRIRGRALYTFKAGDIDHATPLNPGTHRFPADEYLLVVDDGDNTFISFASGCTMDVAPFSVNIRFSGNANILTGVKKNMAPEIESAPDIDGIFRCVSRLCSTESPETPYRSHPLFRRPLPSIALVEGYQPEGSTQTKRDIHFTLPPDLSYLYTAAPLAYYLNASVGTGESPSISIRGTEHMLPADIKGFQRHMSEMLRRMFHFDTIVRTYAGSDTEGVVTGGLSKDEARKIFFMSMCERFLLYARISDAGPGLWHMASYLDPVPSNVRALPHLLTRLSAIYVPESMPISEKDLVSLSVRGYLRSIKPKKGYRGAVSGTRRIVRPALQGAREHYWLAEGFPVDAVKAPPESFENRRRFPHKERKRARVGVICNEDVMKGEISNIIDALAESPASVEVQRNVSVSEFSDAFGEGYDLIQFIGHCDSRGFKCKDGYARASNIDKNQTPMFFFNSCASHLEAVRFIEKGSVCGIATLYRVLEEAAMDVCKGFYMMLGAGYPALTALTAAKECSVLGKEYALIGDGSYSCFGAPDLMKPFYRIDNGADGYRITATVSNARKGFLLCDGRPNGYVDDFGFISEGLTIDELVERSKTIEGYCLNDGTIYRSMKEAIKNLAAAENKR